MSNYKTVCALLTLVAFISRFWGITHPDQVVFDEVHFGKFASYYLQRLYFFDVHPPFGKILYAFVGWLVGYDGSFLFDNIGDSYSKYHIPYVAYRSLPALLSTLTIPLVFLTMMESDFSLPACIAAASIVLFDNAHITITRLIMLDSTLIFSIASSIYCYVKFYKSRRQAFTFKWYKWLLLTGVSLSCVISTKYVGVFTFITIGSAVAIDLWNILDINHGLTIRQFARHVIVRLNALLVLPFLIYLFWFQVHFTILNKSGPGDAFMSPEFQSTLAENPLTAAAYDVHYYDKITFKHKDTNAFLHSHFEKYPLRYEDGRISSNGQQVTGVTFEDPNNVWIILPQNDEEVKNKKPVRFNDIVRFYHVGTNSFLLSHDVASPYYPTNQEFTAVTPEVANEKKEFTLFQLRPVTASDGAVVQSKAGYIRVVHVPSNIAMWTHNDKLLPKWAFNQQEVNGNRVIIDRTNTWFVDEIIDLKDPVRLNKPPKKIGKLPFLQKWLELQQTMFVQNSKLTSSHPYSSHPVIWPLTWKGISFWANAGERKQIYFLGNPFGWWLEFFLLVIYCGIFITDQLCLRRKVNLFPAKLRHRLNASTGFFVLSWATHYLPFFIMGRQLFLHHYLPAHLCLALFTGSMLDLLSGVSEAKILLKQANKKEKSNAENSLKSSYKIAWISLTIGLVLLISCFYYFSPLTYGSPSLTIPQVKARKWLGYQLQFAK